MTAKIYTTSTCAQCVQVKKYLAIKGVDYVEVDADKDEARQEAINISGQFSVPVTVINGGVVVGFKPGQIADLLKPVSLVLNTV